MVAVSDLIQKLVGRRKEREAQAKQTFAEVVRALADGETIGEHEVDAMLEACGKEPGELQAAVDTLIRRRAAVAKLAGSKALRPKIQSLESEMQKIGEERAAYNNKCSELVAAKHRECESLRLTADADEGAAKRELEQTAPKSIDERISAIRAELLPLQKKCDTLRESVRRTGYQVDSTFADKLLVRQQIVDSLESRGKSGTSDWHFAVGERDKFQRLVDATTAELAEVQSRIAELEAQQAAADAERYQA